MGIELLKEEHNIFLVDRQVAFLQQYRNDIVRVSSTRYKYQYTVGCVAQDPTHVVHFLQSEVWNRQPLDMDHVDLQYADGLAYLGYLASHAERANILVRPSVWNSVEAMLQSRYYTLVHGDCTLENWILSEDQNLIPIDPGMPRGFCSPHNDLGKILQSCLTYWGYIKQTASLSDCKRQVHQLGMLGVCSGFALVSLFGHWIRIIKNIDRHSEGVRRYGFYTVFPILANEITEIERHSCLDKILAVDYLDHLSGLLVPPTS